MYVDKSLELCDAQALGTSGTGLALVGDQVNLGAAGENIGTGEAMAMVIQVTTAVTSAGAATVQFQVVSDAAAAIATDGSATVHVMSADIPKADLVAGYQVVLPLPPAGDNDYEQYLGLLQNVGTAALTAGAVDAFIVPQSQVQQWKAMPDAL